MQDPVHQQWYPFGLAQPNPWVIPHISNSLNSFKAIIEGSLVGVIKGYTRSLDHGLYSPFISLGIQKVQTFPCSILLRDIQNPAVVHMFSGLGS